MPIITDWKPIMFGITESCSVFPLELYDNSPGFFAAHDSVSQMILVQNLINTAIAAPFALYWFQPVPAGTLVMFLAIGALGTGGHYAITWAYKHAPATLLGPFEFTALIWAVTFGVVFFSEIPSPYTLLGSAIIIGACLAVVQPGRAPERRGEKAHP